MVVGQNKVGALSCVVVGGMDNAVCIGLNVLCFVGRCHAWCQCCEVGNAHGAATGEGYSSCVDMRRACPGNTAHPRKTEAFFLKEKG